MNRILLPVLAFLLVATPASAQTIAISGVEGSGLTQQLQTPIGTVFDVAVWIDPAGLGSSAIEFGYTDLREVAAGVVRTNLWTIVPIFIDPPCLDDECVFGFGQCIAPADPLQIVRFRYIDFGSIGPDVVLEVRGASPSAFDGAPGFVDCDDNLVPLTPGGTSGGITGSGAVFANGAMVLNPTPLVVSGESTSFARLKVRFDD